MNTSAKQIAGEGTQSLNCIANGLLVCLAIDKMDEGTLAKMEEKMSLQKIYSWVEFKSELEKHANQLSCRSDFEEHKGQTAKTLAAAIVSKKDAEEAKCAKDIQGESQKQSCFAYGGGGHPIWVCASFEELSPTQRWDKTVKSRRCFNCLAWYRRE